MIINANSNSQSTKEMPALVALEAELDGELYLPGDAQYEAAHQAWNLSFRHQPAVIVMAQSASDVAAAVRFANSQNLGIAIQATGHGVGRVADGALLINTSRMNGVFIDEEQQTAWIEGGAKWQVVLDKAAPLGLAPLLGSTPDVSAVGYTLGGGMGWLARKYGMSIDSVKYFDVILPNGEFARASETENADLFWALRGGGSNFGIVVAMEVQLYPEAIVYGGNLLYPASLSREVLVRFREWVTTLPENMTAAVSIMHYPPMPELPEFLRGQSFIQIRGLYAGPTSEGEALLKYWLDWQAPIANLWQEIPFGMIATVSNDPVEPMPSLVSGAWLNELSDAAIDAIMQFMFVENSAPPVMMMEIRHSGGAVSRVAKSAMAYSSRDANFLWAAGGLTFNAEMHALVKDYIAAFKTALGPSLAGAYLNFTEGEERREATRASFTEENFRRLQAIKAKYDAANRFDYGFQIPPTE